MPSYDRRDRVSEEIKKQLTQIINSRKDLQKPAVFSVLHAEVTRDFRQCKVGISALCSPEELQAFVKQLQAIRGWISHELGGRMSIHHIPQLHFVADDSIAHSVYMGALINGLDIPPQEEPQPEDLLDEDEI